MRRYAVCNGVECPIDAFNPRKDLVKKVVKNMTEKDKIIEIFFGIQNGELPEEYLPLKEKYLKDKEALGGNCSSCQLNGLMKQYKNKIIAGKLN